MSVTLGIALLVLVQLMVVPPLAHAAWGAKNESAYQLELFEERERQEMLQRLARPLMYCMPQNPDRTYTMFHGCTDWHSAVHAAYALYAIYRHTGDVEALAAVEAQVRPELFAAELDWMASNPETWETPYGMSWFLMTARERELATGDTSMRFLAEFAEERLINYFSNLAEETRYERMLSPMHRNTSFSLINLVIWARHTQNSALESLVRGFAEDSLFIPALDDECPISNDQRFGYEENEFFPPCLLRIAAVSKIFGDERLDWILDRVPNSHHVESLFGEDNSSAHESGINWSRAFSLWWIYETTKQPLIGLDAVRILKDHLSQPYHWDIESGQSTLHFVPQFGVRMISETYEPSLPAGPDPRAPDMPDQIAIGDVWAADTGTFVEPESHGYVELLHASIEPTDGEIPLMNLATKENDKAGPIAGGTLIHDHIGTHLPYVEGVAAAARRVPKADHPRLVTVQTGFDSRMMAREDANDIASPWGGGYVVQGFPLIGFCSFLVPGLFPTVEDCIAGLVPDLDDIREQRRQTMPQALEELRSQLEELFGRLRAAFPGTTIVVGTYDNMYRNSPCNLNAGLEGTVRDGFQEKMEALTDDYLEGYDGVGIGVNDVIRKVAAQHNIGVADLYGLLTDAQDWQDGKSSGRTCYPPSAAGHTKIAQAFEAVARVPVAQDDSFTAQLSSLLEVSAPGFLVNDLDSYDEGQLGVATSGTFATAACGSVVINADGSFEYSPPPGFVGTDSFAYTPTDGEWTSDAATVSITVERPDAGAGDADRARPGVSVRPCRPRLGGTAHMATHPSAQG